jgi:Phosphotransferase enzyme family
MKKSFFAQSWWRGTPTASGWVDMLTISSECYSRFNYLLDVLPERFTPAVTEVQDALPQLLTGDYPVVVTHSDLNEMNILVDTNSGGITGVVDWTGASIQPFGFTLYALKNALGSMGRYGWEWFGNAKYLRDEFWRAFRQLAGVSSSQMALIRLAGRAGILIRYGTAYDSSFAGMVGVRDPSSDDFAYLDALL